MSDAVRATHLVDSFDDEVTTPDLIRLYLDEIGRAPLLDAATEVDLAQRIEAGLYARHLLAQLGGTGELGHRRAVKLHAARKVASTEELSRLADDGEAAKRAFIRSNLRLARAELISAADAPRCTVPARRHASAVHGTGPESA